MDHVSSNAPPGSPEEQRAAVLRALEDYRSDQAISLLTPWIEAGYGAIAPADRPWVFQACQRAWEQAGRPEDGLRQLEPLYHSEPRDQAVAVAYGDLAWASGQLEQAVRVWQRLMVHHQDTLKPEQATSILTRLGDYHREHDQVRQAQIAYDQALAIDPSNQTALAGMLQIAEEQPDPQAGYHTLQLLLKRLQEPEAIATVLQRQGDTLRHRKQDYEGALRFYGDALELVPRSPEVLQSVAEVLQNLGEVKEAMAVYLELAKIPPRVGPSRTEEYLDLAWECLQASRVSEMQQVRVLEQILDLSPGRLQLFEVITRTLREVEEFDELAKSYERMIQRVKERGQISDTRVLPLLYRNLGEVLAVQLGRPDRAIQPLLEACRLLPDDVELRRRTLELLIGRDDRLDDARAVARELLDLVPGDPLVKTQLAELQLKAGLTDQAYCLLRVARSESQFSDVLEQSFQRLARARFRLPEQPLTEELERRYVRPKSQQTVLNSAFGMGSVVFHKLFSSDLSTHGIREKDRLDPNEPILFNRVYKAVGDLLLIKEPPRVYLKRDLTGMSYAGLDQPAFFVGPDMLSGRSERELTFLIAQQLVLTRPEYVLATLLEAPHLKTIILVMTHKVEPSLQIKLGPEVKSLTKQLDRRMTPELLSHLKELVGLIIQEGITVDVKIWVESVADTANRIGLLFCDDQEMADRCLAMNPGVKGAPNEVERTARLHRWACSTRFFELRKALGVGLK
ncbi:MAG: hypothetical protein JW797_01175 [Bradymonadales bacterium]|nr:hypothetical protein [Bradymonadales bacterium]